MRICATCGTMLDDDEITCPVCGVSRNTDSLAETPSDVTVQTQSHAGAEGMPGYVPVFETTYFDIEELRAHLADSDNKDTDHNDDTLDESAEKDGNNSDSIPEAASYAVPNTSEPPKQQDNLLNAMKSGRGKLILILTIIALLGIVGGIVVPMLRLSGASDKQKAYMDYLCGSWISEPFMYSDATYPSREIFTLGSDNTYSSRIVTSPNSDDQYDPDTWTETDIQEGTFIVDTSEAAIQVSFTLKGSREVYLRYIRRLDAQSLTLREYYNEQKTDYYDVAFTRR